MHMFLALLTLAWLATAALSACAGNETEFGIWFTSEDSLSSLLWTVKHDAADLISDDLLGFSPSGANGTVCVSCGSDYVFDLISTQRSGLPSTASYQLTKSGFPIHQGTNFTTSSPFFFDGCPVSAPTQSPTAAPSASPTVCTDAKVEVTTSSNASWTHIWTLADAETEELLMWGFGPSSHKSVCLDCATKVVFSMFDCEPDTDDSVFGGDDAFTISINDGLITYSADAINSHYIHYFPAACTAPTVSPTAAPSASPTVLVSCEEQEYGFASTIVPDSNPDQVSWQLTHVPSGNVVLSGSNSSSDSICLTDCGLYSYDIIDTGMDGISSGGSVEGYFDGTVFLTASDFGAFKGGSFEIECPAECNYASEQLVMVNITSPSHENVFWAIDADFCDLQMGYSAGASAESLCVPCDSTYFFYLNYASTENLSYSLSLNGTEISQSDSLSDFGEAFSFQVPACS